MNLSGLTGSSKAFASDTGISEKDTIAKSAKLWAAKALLLATG
jgi:hypothetical protein